MDKNIERIELSTEQIAKLFDFVKSKYVKFVDLQFELVDHLASGIEARMSIDSSLSFEQALKEIYMEFPVTGFSDFTEGQEKALIRYWCKKYWLFFKSYFTFPKVLLTIGIFFSYYLSYYSIGNIVMVLHTLAFFALTIIIISRMNMISSSVQKGNYLFLSTYKRCLVGIVGFSLIVYDLAEMIANNINMFQPLKPVWLSLILTIAIIIMHALATEFPKMIKNEINAKYSHLRIKIYA